MDTAMIRFFFSWKMCPVTTIEESHCRRLLQVERYAYGVRNMDFDSSLAPYDLPHHAAWWHLSNFINQAVINRLRKCRGLILQVVH